ncbi:MAG: hypothetical protein L6R43_19500, partial [Planctomycetes bacterium]|nr:hypothetical protein [Planctomycetota bacterium]
MFCPQCGSQLGEGAKGCAACGWTSSRKTLWIVLGSIFGVLFLLCCGGATWVFFKAKKAVEIAQEKATPITVCYHRVSVINYAKARGKLPESLAEAAKETLVIEKDKGEDGSSGTVKIDMKSGGQDADTWQRPLRYTKNDGDGSFEVRSAGPDGVFDNADDIVERGNLSDDLEAAKKDFERKAKEFGREMVRGFGFNPDNVEGLEVEPAPLET